jgi:hypothetical protein
MFACFFPILFPSNYSRISCRLLLFLYLGPFPESKHGPPSLLLAPFPILWSRAWTSLLLFPLFPFQGMELPLASFPFPFSRWFAWGGHYCTSGCPWQCTYLHVKNAKVLIVKPNIVYYLTMQNMEFTGLAMSSFRSLLFIKDGLD